MDIQIDVSRDDATFALFAGHDYELTVAGLSVTMSAPQFQQLCDNLRPWIVESPLPEPPK